jgi:hypothetical protein
VVDHSPPSYVVSKLFRIRLASPIGFGHVPHDDNAKVFSPMVNKGLGNKALGSMKIRVVQGGELFGKIAFVSDQKDGPSAAASITF